MADFENQNAPQGRRFKHAAPQGEGADAPRAAGNHFAAPAAEEGQASAASGAHAAHFAPRVPEQEPEQTVQSSEPAVAAPQGTQTEAYPAASMPVGDALDMRSAYEEELVRVKRKKHKGLKRLGIALAVIAVLVAGCGIALATWINSLNASMGFADREEEEELRRALLPESELDDGSAFYILLLGSDAREGDTASRSDVTMLARVDPENAAVDLISIPRDTMVTIEGSTQKINAAYAFGGASGAVEAVSEFAGVPISHYAEIHFDELEEVVDQLGGVWVDVPESFSAGNGGMSFTEGEQLLSGEEALAYARERYNVSGGDFGRAQAQRQIVEAIIRQVIAAPATELPGLIGKLANSVTTDYSVPDLVTLAQQFIGRDLTLYSAAVPSYAYNADGVSYVGTMFDEWRAMMQRVDAGLDPNDETAEIPEEQLQNEELGAATNSAAPRDYRAIAESSGLTTDDVAPTE